jgi:hypothetical protein
MAMFGNEPGWPPTPIEGDVWADFAAHATASGDIVVGWANGEPHGARAAVRAFLEAELAYRRGGDAEASYVRLIAARPPRPGDHLSKIGKQGPFAAFVSGLYPMAPEHWPVMALDELIAAALAQIPVGK